MALVEFQTLGFFKEIYANGKFIGCINNVEKDRDTFGYYGKQTETLTNDLVTSNKRKVKAGTTITTQLFPLCGKVTKNLV